MTQLDARGARAKDQRCRTLRVPPEVTMQYRRCSCFEALFFHWSDRRFEISSVPSWALGVM